MLTKAKRDAITREAQKRGVDPAAALKEAERIMGESEEATPPSESKGEEGQSSEPGAPVRPVANQLLIGHLPFIKVRELRSLWLGLSERIPDDEMMCGEFQAKYGGGAGGGGAGGGGAGGGGGAPQ